MGQRQSRSGSQSFLLVCISDGSQHTQWVVLQKRDTELGTSTAFIVNRSNPVLCQGELLPHASRLFSVNTSQRHGHGKDRSGPCIHGIPRNMQGYSEPTVDSLFQLLLNLTYSWTNLNFHVRMPVSWLVQLI